jgi:hypothetical protein
MITLDGNDGPRLKALDMSEAGTPASLLYTMNEAAARLRVCRRVLQEVIKHHPYYFSNGRRKLFTESDMLALIAAMREDGAVCRSNSFRPEKVSRLIGPFGAPISGPTWNEAQRRLTALRQPKSSSSGKTK